MVRFGRNETYFGRVEIETSQCLSQEAKSKYVQEMPEKYIAVDTETTGLNAGRDRIIEIGAVKVKGRTVVDSYSCLVNPGRTLHPRIVSLTGISDDMLSGEEDISKVLPEFLRWFDGVPMVGHNLRFDIGFLKAEAASIDECFPDVSTYDTMHLSRKLFPQERRHRLVDLIQRFDIADHEEHRALSDAQQTHECFEWMRTYMNQV